MLTYARSTMKRQIRVGPDEEIHLDPGPVPGLVSVKRDRSGQGGSRLLRVANRFAGAAAQGAGKSKAMECGST
jgi:hypothetical protein